MIYAIKNLLQENTKNALAILVEKVAQEQKEQQMKYKGKTIRKNKKCNSWYTRFRYAGNQFYISGKTQLECLQNLKRALRQISSDGVIEVKTIAFIEWYNKWLELYKIGKVKSETIRDYTSLLKLIPDTIKVKNIAYITLEEIIKSINACEGTRQRQKLYDFYNMIFKKAEDNEIIKKNPMVKIDKPKHEKNHGQALDNKQQGELIKACKQITNSDFILIALYQGLRRGEVLGLTIDNIDFEKNTLTINKAWNNKNQFDTTKNKYSNRTMPLFEKTKQILLKYKNQKERIFDITIKQYELILKAIKDESKIEALKLKDMRSTFITRCKELNIPEQVIQSWVGHQIGSTVTGMVYTKHNSDIDYNYINIINNSELITKKE